MKSAADYVATAALAASLYRVSRQYPHWQQFRTVRRLLASIAAAFRTDRVANLFTVYEVRRLPSAIDGLSVGSLFVA